MFVDKLKSYNIVIGILSLEILLATLSVVWIYNIYEDFGYITLLRLSSVRIYHPDAAVCTQCR